jgi:hypothetical protein
LLAFDPRKKNEDGNCQVKMVGSISLQKNGCLRPNVAKYSGKHTETQSKWAQNRVPWGKWAQALWETYVSGGKDTQNMVA